MVTSRASRRRTCRCRRWTRSALDRRHGQLSTRSTRTSPIPARAVLERFDGTRWRTEDTPITSPSRLERLDMAVDPDGVLWVWHEGEPATLWRFDGSAWSTVPLPFDVESTADLPQLSPSVDPFATFLVTPDGALLALRPRPAAGAARRRRRHRRHSSARRGVHTPRHRPRRARLVSRSGRAARGRARRSGRVRRRGSRESRTRPCSRSRSRRTRRGCASNTVVPSSCSASPVREALERPRNKRRAAHTTELGCVAERREAPPRRIGWSPKARVANKDLTVDDIVRAVTELSMSNRRESIGKPWQRWDSQPPLICDDTAPRVPRRPPRPRRKSFGH